MSSMQQLKATRPVGQIEAFGAYERYLADPTTENCNAYIDLMEAILVQSEDERKVTLPLEHIFTPGIYVRRCIIGKGVGVVSHTHSTEGPFVVMKGDIAVFSYNEGHQRYKGPFMGVTKSNTRRILFAMEDTFWITFHPNPDNITDVDELVKRSTVPLKNPLLCQWEQYRL